MAPHGATRHDPLPLRRSPLCPPRRATSPLLLAFPGDSDVRLCDPGLQCGPEYRVAHVLDRDALQWQVACGSLSGLWGLLPG